jgi:hypothetical protein
MKHEQQDEQPQQLDENFAGQGFPLPASENP